VAEPSDDEIAAPDIEAAAKASTESAATTFLRSIELSQDRAGGERQR
jgi:hypothetical protein